MAERIWFVAAGDRQEGPFPESELAALVAAGRLTPDTLVWTQGMANWQRAGEVPDFVFSARPPPQAPSPPPQPLPGSPEWAPTQQGREMGAAFSSDFDVWGLFGRYWVVVNALLYVVWAPWACVSCIGWMIRHIQIPHWPQLGFEGKVGDIWWAFVLLSPLSLYVCGIVLWLVLTHVFDLPQVATAVALVILSLAVVALLTWIVLRWMVANVSSEGHPLGLQFDGHLLPFVGWNLLALLAIFTIIGWAWVTTAYMRWFCAHVASRRRISFVATGWQVLWRVIVLELTSAFVIPFPWMLAWYVRWFISQFAIDDKSA